MIHITPTVHSILLHAGIDGGALAGFLHPLLSFDHLLAMVAVGMLSTQIGGRAVWYVPAAFVGVMAVGGILGVAGLPLLFVEYGIAASVFVLGLAILADTHFPIGVAMIFVAFFALFHGHAHGSEIPAAIVSKNVAYIAAYVNGFLSATASLHLIGVFLGMFIELLPYGAQIMRLAGALLAIIGVSFTIQL